MKHEHHFSTFHKKIISQDWRVEEQFWILDELLLVGATARCGFEHAKHKGEDRETLRCNSGTHHCLGHLRVTTVEGDEAERKHQPGRCATWREDRVPCMNERYNFIAMTYNGWSNIETYQAGPKGSPWTSAETGHRQIRRLGLRPKRIRAGRRYLVGFVSTPGRRHRLSTSRPQLQE